MNQSASRRCPRCRDSLAEGVRFCVACGCAVDDDLAERKLKIEGELARRRWWRSVRLGFSRGAGAISRLFRWW